MKFLAEFFYFFLRIKPVTWVLSKILEHWEVNDTFPTEGVDAMAVISYASAQGKRFLTLGSWIVISEIKLRINRETILGWGIFKGPTQEEERELKETLLQNWENICVGTVTSSTDECESILEAWLKTGKRINSIGVGAEGAHSRRDQLVWQYYLPKYFPDAKLYFCSAGAKECADPKNPMHLQRYWQVWLLFNIFFYPLYRWFPGVAWFAKRNFHQASS